MALSGDDFEKLVKEHMDAQPYSCKCADCGKDVELDIEVDNDFDMKITVPVCDCAKDE